MTTTTTTTMTACESIKSLLQSRGVIEDNPALLVDHDASGLYFPRTQKIVWSSGSYNWCETLTHESVHYLQHLPGGKRLKGEPEIVNPRLPREVASRIREEVQAYYPQSQWEIEYGAWALEHEPEVVLKLLEQAAPPPPPRPGIPAPLGVGMAIAISALATWLMLRSTK